MTIQLMPEQILSNVIGLGRAYVRIVESAEILAVSEKMTRPVIEFGQN